MIVHTVYGYTSLKVNQIFFGNVHAQTVEPFVTHLTLHQYISDKISCDTGVTGYFVARIYWCNVRCV